MLMLKSTHEAVVKELKAEIARTGVLLTGAQEDLSVAHSQRRHAEAERDAARAELARWKPARGTGGKFQKADAA
jgi:chemotaxis methyl-accepting protein methylase